MPKLFLPRWLRVNLSGGCSSDKIKSQTLLVFSEERPLSARSEPAVNSSSSALRALLPGQHLNAIDLLQPGHVQSGVCLNDIGTQSGQAMTSTHINKEPPEGGLF
jgi:hypothetical protein